MFPALSGSATIGGKSNLVVRRTWNFTKFLIGRDGSVKGRYEPTFTPEELDLVIKKFFNLIKICGLADR